MDYCCFFLYCIRYDHLEVYLRHRRVRTLGSPELEQPQQYFAESNHLRIEFDLDANKVRTREPSNALTKKTTP